MRDSSSNAPTSVLLPLFLASLAINAFQHAFHGSRLDMLKQASDLYEKKFEQQEKTIAQLQKDKDTAEAKLIGYIQGRR